LRKSRAKPAFSDNLPNIIRCFAIHATLRKSTGLLSSLFPNDSFYTKKFPRMKNISLPRLLSLAALFVFAFERTGAQESPSPEMVKTTTTPFTGAATTTATPVKYSLA
jgi:hypothetical protein